MAVEILTATRRSALPMTAANARAVASNVNLVGVVSTLEVPAASSVNSTFTMARVPSTARLMPSSTVYFDDLATTGSPTFDFGVGTDIDALNDGVGVAAAAGSAGLFKAANINKAGQMAWELAGLSADPGAPLDITITLLDAACDAGGTVTLELFYTLD